MKAAYFLFVAAAAVFGVATASAQYPQWRHSGSIFVLTTPQGANLPAGAEEKDFPLLVRLDGQWFDFRQAQANGEDIRFATGAGEPLAYQIEQWDPSAKAASIWVRIPVIQGNARQEIKTYWGNPSAESQSDGKAVFNGANDYLSVWHMTDPVRDEVGTLQSNDTGTTSSCGRIGKGRHFPGHKGINGGEEIAEFPVGANSHSTEAWFRAEVPNATVLAWGNEKAQGKVVVKFASPPHVRTDCYFSNGNVRGESRLATNRWIHVLHAYQSGDSRIYVNGVLDGTNTSPGSPLAIRSPARLYIGGWYNNYDFVGDIDEVRISNVARSADWARLQYENQKPMQTLVGPLVRPGNTFSVAEKKLEVLEGERVTVDAQADGAQKIYWIIQRGKTETVVAVDQYRYTLDAGRVADDEDIVLQIKAVYPDQVKTEDIPVKIREDIPEPDFLLQAPKAWDGRETIEVVPEIRNLQAMRAAGAGELDWHWTVSGGAVIKEVAPGKLILKRSQFSGKLVVQLAINNGGDDVVAKTMMVVTEPTKDPWVQRTPDKNEKPVDNQFYARDDDGEGTLHCNGSLDQPADEVFLRLYADDALMGTLRQKPADGNTYAFTVALQPGLIKYRVELGYRQGDIETIPYRADNIVCGDAYVIDGQSNALATDTRENAPRETDTWIRSYGYPEDSRDDGSQNLWCNPVWKFEGGEAHRASRAKHKAQLGWWGMELAKRLVESQKVPICIINGAVGGTRIDQHQRNAENDQDLTTIYGRLLWRVRQARLTHGIRAVLWHQGENDQGAAGPDGGYGWQSYQRYFVELSAAWKEDFPNIQHYYVFQIWPNACSMGGGNGDMLREVQRTLPRLYSKLDVMSTLGIRPSGPCHYPLEGWSQFARLIQPLIERDFYGRKVTAPVTAPSLQRAYYTNERKDAVALQFDQAVVWKDSLKGEFYLDGAESLVASASVSGNVLTLRLKEPSAAESISYLNEMAWSQDRLLVGKNGIAALTFCAVPIVEGRIVRSSTRDRAI